MEETFSNLLPLLVDAADPIFVFLFSSLFQKELSQQQASADATKICEQPPPPRMNNKIWVGRRKLGFHIILQKFSQIQHAKTTPSVGEKMTSL
jgi:hypothetical protein